MDRKTKIKRTIAKLMPEDFPIGLIVVLANYVDSIVKAFGGCEKCYGKGYGTQIEFASGGRKKWQLPVIVFCTCERGKQLARFFHNRDELVITSLLKSKRKKK